MDPNQADLFSAIWQMVKAGEWLKLVLYLCILWSPWIIAMLSKWRADGKIEGLYKARLSDKDKEIERLAARMKELENVSLRTKRK